jgi:hypothetical protein
MNWPLFWQLLATAVVAFVGAWLAHTFAANRDLKNKRRDQRISYLIEAYRRLEFVSNRPSLTDLQPMESAVADIQLFGSPSQIRLAQAFVTEFATTKSTSLDAILTELRKDLRSELQLESVPDKLLFLRYHSHSGERSA